MLRLNAPLSTKPLSSVICGYVYLFCYGDLARGDKVNVGAVKVSCPWFKPAIVNNQILSCAQTVDAIYCYIYVIRQHGYDNERAYPRVVELAGAPSWW